MGSKDNAHCKLCKCDFSLSNVGFWPTMTKIMNHWMTLSTSRQTKCRRFEVVTIAVLDPLIVAKLNFVGLITGHLIPYLTTYQSQEPLIPFLYDDLRSLYVELLGLSIKLEILEACRDDGKELLKINIRNVKNQMRKQDTHIGFGAQQELLSILRKDSAAVEDINKFRLEARKFLITLLEKMFNKSHISFNIVKRAAVLDPKFFLLRPLDVYKSVLQRLLFTLVQLKIICSSHADQALSEFSCFHTASFRERKTSYEVFQKNSNRLDDCYEKEVEISNFKVLSSVVKLALVLSHGQAKVERGFSMNNKILTINLKEVSITSRRLIIDYMISRKLVPQLFPITKSLLKSVSYFRQKYERCLKERESARK